MVPALWGTRCGLVPVLEGDQVEFGRKKGVLALRQVLVVREVALSVILMIGSTLLLRSLLKATAVPPGFDTRKNVIILTMAPPELYKYNKNESPALYRSLVQRLQALPGVKRSSYPCHPPLVDYEQGEPKRVFCTGELAE